MEYIHISKLIIVIDSFTFLKINSSIDKYITIYIYY